jgi:hypothetical protein
MPAFRLRVRYQGRLARLRGIEVERIEHAAIVSRVPGSALGMALVHGQIIPVLQLGETEGCLVVGRIEGDLLGITGLEVIGFESPDSGVEPPAPPALGVDVTSLGARPGQTLDSHSDQEFELDLDIVTLVASAKLRQQHALQPSEVNP